MSYFKEIFQNVIDECNSEKFYNNFEMGPPKIFNDNEILESDEPETLNEMTKYSDLKKKFLKSLEDIDMTGMDIYLIALEGIKELKNREKSQTGVHSEDYTQYLKLLKQSL